MPVWHERLAPRVANGDLFVLGVIQEQHAERCLLFAQWRGLDWAILHDPIDVMETAAVPVFVAIDEAGIVRSSRARLDTFEAEFLDVDFGVEPAEPVPARAPDLAELRAAATSPRAWRDYGDALFLWGGTARLDEAIAAYELAAEDTSDGHARFRLGVALRKRHETVLARPGDFQAAVTAWQAALDRDPNQYIWRRRIQQYGPRLDKPYPFYDWVEEATRAVAARGETPVALAIAPYGAELAGPARAFEAARSEGESPDPLGRIQRDGGRVRADVTVVPPAAAPGASVRVHVSLSPAPGAAWNNEAEPLRVWIEAPEGVRLSARVLEAPPGAAAESAETRRLDFELQLPEGAPEEEGKAVTLRAHALFNLCDGGPCRFLRKDLEIVVPLAQ